MHSADESKLRHDGREIWTPCFDSTGHDQESHRTIVISTHKQLPDLTMSSSTTISTNCTNTPPTKSPSTISCPILPPTLCPCNNVRRTCSMVLEDNPNVQIQHDGLVSLAESIISLGDQATEWDADGWHYTGTRFHGNDTNRQERVALYVLALDAINFCFWPHRDQHNNPHIDSENNNYSNSLEYDHLAIALRKLAERDDESLTNDDYFFNPNHLSKLTVHDMTAALEPELQGHYLPNMHERCRLWNELGHGLLHCHHGTALSLIAAAQGSAPNLVACIVRTFPGFRDETTHRGRWVALYKRAQIAVGDLNAALHLDLAHMDHLTTFADYRVPQVLRHFGALAYSSELANKVDCHMELNSQEEVAIRAGTVICVDELVRMVNDAAAAAKSEDDDALVPSMTAVTLDWHLWQVGERMNQHGELKPHHRVNTIFY